MSSENETARRSDPPGGQDEERATDLDSRIAHPRFVSTSLSPKDLDELEKRDRAMLRLGIAAGIWKDVRDAQEHFPGFQLKIPWVVAGEGGGLRVVWIPFGKRKGGPIPASQARKLEVVQGWLKVKGSRIKEVYCLSVPIDPKTLDRWEVELRQKGLLPPG